jgi:hypothetical protein
MPPAADPSTLEGWLSGSDPLLELPGDTDTSAVLEALRHHGLDVHRVDLAGVVDKDTLLETLHRSLDFGDWFGFNWDALEEALFGPEDRAAPEWVLVVTGFRAFREHDPADADVLLDILRTVAETPGSCLHGCVLIA